MGDDDHPMQAVWDVDNAARARLAELVPLLVRALLAVEWHSVMAFSEMSRTCGACHAQKPHGHKDGCVVDTALTAAGLPTQQERDQARETIGSKR